MCARNGLKLLARSRVVVTGLGVVAANGSNRDEFAASLMLGRSGLGGHIRFDSSCLRSAEAGAVSLDLPEIGELHEDEMVVHLAKEAMDQALEDCGLEKEELRLLGRRTGLSFSTSLGSNDRMMKYIRDKATSERTDPRWLTRIPAFVQKLARHLEIGGPLYTTTSACAAGTAAIGIAYDQIAGGRAEVMIAGGADPLTAFSSYGFHALKALSPDQCRPFDAERNGISIGEGSAFFVVESLKHAVSRGARIYGEILSYSIGNEAHHITSPDPSGAGALASMRHALEQANLRPEQINYINAHGTATPLNDEMELKAIGELLGDSVGEVAVSSTKSMTGHCLGAAGSIELAACLLSLHEGFIPPTSRLDHIQEEHQAFRLVKDSAVKAELKYILSNSFAFSGNTSSIVIGKCNV